MAGRIAFEILIFLTPFMLFGLYVLVTTNADPETKRKWPINILFLSGLALATIAWFVLIMLEDKSGTTCKEPNRYVDGEIVKGKEYPCEHDNTSAGRPRSDDPGGSVQPDPK